MLYGDVNDNDKIDREDANIIIDHIQNASKDLKYT